MLGPRALSRSRTRAATGRERAALGVADDNRVGLTVDRAGEGHRLDLEVGYVEHGDVALRVVEHDGRVVLRTVGLGTVSERTPATTWALVMMWCGAKTKPLPWMSRPHEGASPWIDQHVVAGEDDGRGLDERGVGRGYVDDALGPDAAEDLREAVAVEKPLECGKPGLGLVRHQRLDRGQHP